MSDFKAKLLERLSTVPTDRIIEVHRLIRREIDSLYAEEVAKEIEARFKDPSRETVKGRVLHLVDNWVEGYNFLATTGLSSEVVPKSFQIIYSLINERIASSDTYGRGI